MFINTFVKDVTALNSMNSLRGVTVSGISLSGLLERSSNTVSKGILLLQVSQPVIDVIIYILLSVRDLTVSNKNPE